MNARNPAAKAINPQNAEITNKARSLERLCHRMSKLQLTLVETADKNGPYAEIRNVAAKLGSSDPGLNLASEVGPDTAIDATCFVVGGLCYPVRAPRMMLYSNRTDSELFPLYRELNFGVSRTRGLPLSQQRGEIPP